MIEEQGSCVGEKRIITNKTVRIEQVKNGFIVELGYAERYVFNSLAEVFDEIEKFFKK